MPSIDKFYSKIKSEHVSVENYEHEKTVWNTLNISTLAQYAELYFKIDIMLLPDIIQNFTNLRITCVCV